MNHTRKAWARAVRSWRLYRQERARGKALDLLVHIAKLSPAALPEDDRVFAAIASLANALADANRASRRQSLEP